jgi:hypothetical protein
MRFSVGSRTLFARSVMRNPQLYSMAHNVLPAECYSELLMLSKSALSVLKYYRPFCFGQGILLFL